MSSWIAPLTKRFAFVALLLSIFPTLEAQATTDSVAINKLLGQVKIHSTLAVDDAATLDSYARSPTISWQSHSGKLRAIKEHVNDLIEDCNQMSSLRGEGSAWQQETIDRINPLLHEIADHLTATVEHLKGNPDQTLMQAYRDYVHTNFELIDNTQKLISDFSSYSRSKDKAQTLEQKLELPTVAGERQ
ncbi:hypothetical protein DYQ86_09765 [Acidobacteria bacterium AB60]|nr:hypothetical protein DYQ86_09765 [Acidobacteria bacterium AB60]